MTNRADHCENCRFWHLGATRGTGNQQGLCRWRPTYVRRDALDWCGQFELIPPTTKPPRPFSPEPVTKA